MDRALTISGNNHEITTSDVRHFRIIDVGELTLRETIIDGQNGPGGIEVEKSDLNLESGSLQNVDKPGFGGAVQVSFGASFTMTGGTIQHNNASNGGGIYNTGWVYLLGGSVSNNTATLGGGVFNGLSGQLIMSAGEISHNTASSNGGGIAVARPTGAGSGSISIVTIKNEARINNNYAYQGWGYLWWCGCGNYKPGRWCYGGQLCKRLRWWHIRRVQTQCYRWCDSRK